MAKVTVAELEAALVEQAAMTAQLALTVGELSGAVALLNERLNNAGQAFKALRAEVDHLRSNQQRPSSRVAVKPQANPWHVALNQLRKERGLSETAWVKHDDVLARMTENAQPTTTDEVQA